MTRRVASWTKKFSIPKGYVTTRNKYMCCEKLYYGYDLRQRRFVTVKATPGNVDLRDVSGLLTRRVLRYGEPQRLHAVFDAGAGKSDADVRALLNRVEVHDASSNAAKCGYDKESPDRKHPRFCRGPLQMIGCLVGLFYNACADFAAELGPAWENVFIRTLRRTFFNQAGKLYCTPTSVALANLSRAGPRLHSVAETQVKGFRVRGSGLRCKPPSRAAGLRTRNAEL